VMVLFFCANATNDKPQMNAIRKRVFFITKFDFNTKLGIIFLQLVILTGFLLS
jgi:hypothetical protein